MKKKFFLFFFFFSFVYAQWPGVSIICASAYYFSKIIFILGFLYILKVGYRLVFPQGSSADLSSEKRTLAFVILGLAFAIAYSTIFKNISGIRNICP